MTIPSKELTMTLLSYIPRRPDYNMWLEVVSAIGNTYPEGEALNILLSHFQDETKNEHKAKLKGRLSKVNYGTLVYIAEQYGYNPENHPNIDRHNDFNTNVNRIIPPKAKPVTFSSKPLLCYKFEDYEAEERSAIMQYEGGLTREEADTKVFEDFPNAERVYRLSVNSRVLNKNLDPPTRLEYPNHTFFTDNFKNQYLTCKELAYTIGKGHSIALCKLKENDKGKIIRRSNNFNGSEMIGIDIDNQDPTTKERIIDGYLSLEEALSLPTTKEALLIYTTSNHTEDWNRYRIFFDLPRLIEDPDQYKKLVNYYIRLYGSDENCSDVARGF